MSTHDEEREAPGDLAFATIVGDALAKRAWEDHYGIDQTYGLGGRHGIESNDTAGQACGVPSEHEERCGIALLAIIVRPPVSSPGDGEGLCDDQEHAFWPNDEGQME